MSKFSKKLISSIVPAANTAGIYNAAEQLQNLTALAITAINFCADSSGNANGLNDDTAINTAGGFVKLTGSGFTSATIVYINGISVTKYYLNTTTIVATVPAAVAGTTASLMVFNGSTVGSIWAAGISYSGFPSWTTTAASNAGFVVSTQLVATGDAPLVYTFVSGTLPPNCTISSSGLLSGTVTGVGTNAIYTFTVAVTDAQNQNVSQSIVYTLVVSDAFYRYTSLHISGDSNPTWITDASTNVLAVTSVGAPQSTIFSPLKAGYYGNSFNGSSDWLSIPLTAGLTLGSGDFTIEAWIYKNTSGSGEIFGKTGSVNYAIDCQTSPSNYPQISLSSNGTATTIVAGATALATNRWYHVAWVRSGTTINIYLNGVLDGTGVFSGAIFSGSNVDVSGIGARPGGGTVDTWFNGSISNLRVVKGTAVYTANFTPSATPLTAITNTSLLTCQSARFIDNSAAPVTITVAGTPKVVSSNPFNLPSGLSAYGAGYFDGSSYLSVPATSTFAFGTGDFTLECWINGNSTTYASGAVCAPNVYNGGSLYWGLTFSSGNIAWQSSHGNVNLFSISAVAYYNTWLHLTVVRSSGTTKMYFNGVQVGSAADTNNYVLTTTYNIARNGDGPYNIQQGYLSNLRIVKGTAVYTAAFTPPTAPLTAITNTSLLTLQTNVPHNNSQFRDTSTNNALITRYGNVTQGSFSPFTKQYPYSTATVGGSAYFDSTAGDYLNIADPTGTFNFGSGNFTVEAWVYSRGGNNVMIWGNGTSGNNWVAFYTSTSAEFAIAVGGAVPLDVLTGTNSIIPDQWSHVALVRSGDVFTIYINGIKGSSGTRAGVVPYYDTTNTYFGGPRWPGDTASSNGYMSNLRIVKGVALYTSNFTPSTAPLTAVSGTVLLMPFTNAAVYDNTMLSNLETVGNVQVNTSVFKYGTGSLKFNGSTDYLTIPASANTSFGTGDFTVEFWINTAGANSQILSLASGTAAGNWQVSLYNGNFYWQSARNTTDALYVASTSITNSLWHHVVITRASNTLRIFFDGTQQGSVTDSTNYNVTSVLNIGYSTTYFNGYIDELRITKGYARYTTAFTPSTGAFSASAPFGTSVLPSKSLRFRASASAYLDKTPATTTNQRTWTWSAWVKRGILGSSTQDLFIGTSGGNFNGVRIIADQIYVQDYQASVYNIFWTTTAVYRDPAAWYHVVVNYDTTQASSTNAVSIWINGTIQAVTFTASLGAYVQNRTGFINTASTAHYISRGNTAQYYDGELAEINFVDGLALAPTMFGAYSAYNQWLPVSYSGYMGANGFYLPFNVGTDTSSVSVSYLAVAGGGGGGTGQSASTVGNGGGGGAGGLLTGTTSLVINGVYPVVVGAGGNAGTPGVNSGSGANSTAFGVTATGGGAGGSYNGNNGQTGGSGGGAGYGGTAGSGTSGQGYAGGAGNTAGSPYQAGGGGGAGAVGTNGPGGIGVQSSITGSSVYYAGGGAGGNGSNVTGSSGGSGGGGTGGYGTTAGTAGTANLGGGGGGGGNQGTGGTNSSNGAAGGSGVIIISYSGTQKFYGGNVTSVGGNTIHTFTTSGSLTGVFGDQSGNNNNWTPNNINVSTVGPTYDLLTDVPTLTSATAANYAVLNPLQIGGVVTSPTPIALSNGNLSWSYNRTTSGSGWLQATIAIPSTGKWYYEYVSDSGSPVAYSEPGIMDIATPKSQATPSQYRAYYGYDGTKLSNGVYSAYGTTAALNDVLSVAIDMDNGALYFGKNGTYLNSGVPTSGASKTGAAFTDLISAGVTWVPMMGIMGNSVASGYVNFGQRPFTYTAPSGFLPLNTYNI